jgi:hypothetical protein
MLLAPDGRIALSRYGKASRPKLLEHHPATTVYSGLFYGNKRENITGCSIVQTFTTGHHQIGHLSECKSNIWLYHISKFGNSNQWQQVLLRGRIRQSKKPKVLFMRTARKMVDKKGHSIHRYYRDMLNQGSVKKP